MIRPLAVAGPFAISATLVLSACSGGAGKSDPNDPYAGLDAQILSWRDAIEQGHPACKTKVGGKGCEDFEVNCKAAQAISPDETSKGVTAKVVAAMTFNGRNADGSSGKSGSAFAVFSKAGGAWTRAASKPVNMSTCAPL